MTEYSPAKTGEYLRIFPNFQDCTCCEKDLKVINTIASIRHENMLGYLSLDIICSSKLTVTLLENCSLLGTAADKYFSHQMKAIAYIFTCIFTISGYITN